MTRQHKHRENGVKKLHHIIEGFEKALEQLVIDTEAKCVIPGVISNTRKSSSNGNKLIKLQYETPTGWKLILRSGSGTQEAFLVGGNVEKITSMFGEKKRIVI